MNGGDLWQPLGLSVRIAAAATLMTVLLGTPLAYAMARRSFPGRSLVEGFILLPLVLPPTVVGYLLLMSLGSRGWLLQWLPESVDYSIAFQFEGAVLAALIVALPMLYIPAKAAFASVDREFVDAAKIAGANRLQVFWHVSIPLARRGLVSGLLLAFARALGEFGATMMVFGWQPGRITLPISIYADYEQGELDHASAAVVALSVISLGLVLAYNLTLAGKRE
jgi:molybdate transport system permease protein